MASAEKQRLCLPTGVVPRKHFHGLLMTSFPVSERPRNRRAKYPKVRTGCISCKKRHVKCDEVKPSCNRCLKWSGVCGGYEPPCSKFYAPKSTRVTLRGNKTRFKQTLTVSDQKSSTTSSLSESVITPSVAGAEPATPLLLHAYQPPEHSGGPHEMLFSDSSSVGSSLMPDSDIIPTTAINTVGEIGSLDATFWTDTVPRLVNENLAVHYANMAIHILIICKQKNPRLRESPGFGNDHYSLALAHYGIALKQMRDSGDMCGGTRVAVLCSMFFAVFEALNGDREAAEAHLLCGQRMLNELQELLPSGIAATSSGSLRKELPNLLHYIVLQLRTGGATCWKIQCDTLCAEYLEEFVADEQYDASPGYGTPKDYAFMTWPGNDDISAIRMKDLMS